MGKVGRPTKRSPEVEERVLAAVSAGVMLKDICKEPDLPHPQTFLRWCREDERLRALYAHAREDGAWCLVEKLVQWADDARFATDRTTIEGIRVGSVNLKWAAAKFNRQFGDKVQQEHTGEMKVVTQRIVLDTPPPGWEGTA